MERKMDWRKLFFRSLSYLLVAAVASVVSLALWGGRYSKLTELEEIISEKYIGQYEKEKVENAAAKAMVNALQDRWSGYLTPQEYLDHKQSSANTYVGIGITITRREDGSGMDILEVAPGGAAQEAGVLPGDILVFAQGQSLQDMDTDGVKALIVGEEGKPVTLTVLRDGAEMNFSMTCRNIKVTVASGEMREGNIGLVRISNFNAGCGEETIGVIEDLQKQGAAALIFDVRNNPGGYVSQMLKVLDSLLPEGVLFREVDYRGNERTMRSDAACLDMPMAVLVNGNSYSAAEFFAACLREYDRATVVGQQTTGKGYYQTTLPLSDGSAVHLSTGKYFTPNGVSLTEAGGLTPDVPVEVDEKTAALIYAQAVPAAEDAQIQAAVALLAKTEG